MPIAVITSGRSSLSFASALVLAIAASAAFAAPDERADSGTIVAADNGAQAPATPANDSMIATEPGLLSRVHDRASEMVSSAMNFVGVHYRRGGTSAETGFDCSGLTRHVFETSLGLVLPRRADEQAKAPGLIAVKREELQPGDLVFFNTMKKTFSHVGIYIGDNLFVHAPRRGKDVRTDDLSFAYWAKRFTGARRAEAVAEAKAAETVSEPATPVVH
jgi:cell wall-associated NlpC family hydrolase